MLLAAHKLQKWIKTVMSVLDVTVLPFKQMANTESLWKKRQRKEIRVKASELLHFAEYWQRLFDKLHLLRRKIRET